MKVRDLQLYLRYSLSKDILLSFVRSNFLGLFLIFALLNVIDYYNYFERENEMFLRVCPQKSRTLGHDGCPGGQVAYETESGDLLHPEKYWHPPGTLGRIA